MRRHVVHGEAVGETVRLHGNRCCQELVAACRAEAWPARSIHIRLSQLHLDAAMEIIHGHGDVSRDHDDEDRRHGEA